MINIIAAVARNRAIGYKNKLLYWLPNDLKRFKQLTTGHTIIMGRRTFESLPKGALPNRRNIVLSRSKTDFPGCEVFGSLSEAIAHCATDEDVYVIGGASVYKQALAVADRLCLTEIDDTPEQADAMNDTNTGLRLSTIYAPKRSNHHKIKQPHDSLRFMWLLCYVLQILFYRIGRSDGNLTIDSGIERDNRLATLQS